MKSQECFWQKNIFYSSTLSTLRSYVKQKLVEWAACEGHEKSREIVKGPGSTEES